MNRFQFFQFFRTNVVFKQENESIEIENLKEDNHLLKDIIDQAAKSIADVIQVYSKVDG